MKVETVRLSEIGPNPYSKLQLDQRYARMTIEALKLGVAYGNVHFIVNESHQLVVGHHRLTAAKEVLGEACKISVEVRDVPADVMADVAAWEQNETGGK